MVLPPANEESRPPSPTLLKLVAQAFAAQREIEAGGSFVQVAARLGYGREYLADMLRTSFLSPAIITALIESQQPPTLSRKQLVSTNPIPLLGKEQEELREETARRPDISGPLTSWGGSGAPDGIRTHGPQIRNLVLYPAELRMPRPRSIMRRGGGQQNRQFLASGGTTGSGRAAIATPSSASARASAGDASPWIGLWSVSP